MNVRKWSSLCVLSAFGLFLVVNFQNCAPATQAPGVSGLADKTGPQVEEPLPVDVIDHIEMGKVAFVQKTITVEAGSNSVVVDGICAEEQSGAVLSWELRDSRRLAVGGGSADCDRGGFRVALEPAAELACGEAYTLKAQLGVKSHDTVVISRECGDSVAQSE